MRQLIERHIEVDGIGDWVWLEGETGVWEGPSENWPAFKQMWFKYLANRRNCVQAGGALGMYPVLLSKHFQHVYTFEPDPQSYNVLTKNITKSNNITARNVGLGSREGKAYLDMSNIENVGMHYIRNELNAEGNVELITLDSLHLEDVDFIQFDMEGYEYYAIHGAEETIKRWRPVISCEMPSDELKNLFGMWGYREAERQHADTTFVPTELPWK